MDIQLWLCDFVAGKNLMFTSKVVRKLCAIVIVIVKMASLCVDINA